MKHYILTTANHFKGMWDISTPSQHSLVIAMTLITALAFGFWLPDGLLLICPRAVLGGVSLMSVVMNLSLQLRGHTKMGMCAKLLAVFMIGLTLAHVAVTNKNDEIGVDAFDDGARVHVTGFVKMAEVMRGGRQRIRLAAITGEDWLVDDGSDIRLTTARGLRVLHPGDVVSARIKVNNLLPMLLPDSFDFTAHGQRQGYAANGFIDDVTVISRTSTNLGSNLRFGIQSKLSQHMTPDIAAVASSVLIGLRGGITPDIREHFRASGLSHLLAISGLHMALFWGTIMALMRVALACFPHFSSRYPSLKISVMLALPFGVFYLIISGMPVSAVRAFLMLALFMLAILLTRRGVTLHHVALAAIVILVIDPTQLMQPAFQMSFAAVFALVAGWMALSLRTRSDVSHPTILRSRLLTYLGGIMVGSILAGAATMPFVLHHFGITSIWSILANLAGMPLMAGIIMPFGALSILAMPLGVEAPFLAIMGVGISMLLWVADMVAQLPLSRISVVPPISAVLYMFTLAMVLAVMVRGLGRILPILCLIGALGIWSVSPRPVAAFTVLHQRSLAAISDGSAIYYSRKSANSFERSIILRPFGLADQSYIGAAPKMKRGIDMIIHSSGLRIAAVWRWRQLITACGEADLVLVMTPISPKYCGGVLVTLHEIKAHGGALIFGDQRNIMVRYVDGTTREIMVDQ